MNSAKRPQSTARRKILEAHSRKHSAASKFLTAPTPNMNLTPNLPQTSLPNSTSSPFGTIDPNILSTPKFNAPQSSSFTFGSSVQTPPVVFGSGTMDKPQPQGSSFGGFGSGGSSGFTFAPPASGFSFKAGGPVRNPFTETSSSIPISASTPVFTFGAPSQSNPAPKMSSLTIQPNPVTSAPMFTSQPNPVTSAPMFTSQPNPVTSAPMFTMPPSTPAPPQININHMRNEDPDAMRTSPDMPLSQLRLADGPQIHPPAPSLFSSLFEQRTINNGGVLSFEPISQQLDNPDKPQSIFAALAELRAKANANAQPPITPFSNTMQPSFFHPSLTSTQPTPSAPATSGSFGNFSSFTTPATTTNTHFGSLTAPPVTTAPQAPFFNPITSSMPSQELSAPAAPITPAPPFAPAAPPTVEPQSQSSPTKPLFPTLDNGEETTPTNYSLFSRMAEPPANIILPPSQTKSSPTDDMSPSKKPKPEPKTTEPPKTEPKQKAPKTSRAICEDREKKNGKYTYRLRILDFAFQQTIASLSPQTDDFEVVVLTYLKKRRMLLSDVELPKAAGFKRKADEQIQKPNKSAKLSATAIPDSHNPSSFNHPNAAEKIAQPKANVSKTLQSTPKPAPTTNQQTPSTGIKLSGTKRKAEEHISRDDDSPNGSDNKRPRSRGGVSYPTLSSETDKTASQTSQMFKEIAGGPPSLESFNSSSKGKEPAAKNLFSLSQPGPSNSTINKKTPRFAAAKAASTITRDAKPAESPFKFIPSGPVFTPAITDTSADAKPAESPFKFIPSGPVFTPAITDTSADAKPAESPFKFIPSGPVFTPTTTDTGATKPQSSPSPFKVPAAKPVGNLSTPKNGASLPKGAFHALATPKPVHSIQPSTQPSTVSSSQPNSSVAENDEPVNISSILSKGKQRLESSMNEAASPSKKTSDHSLPKPPTFEIPKFGSSGPVNFLAQFTKSAKKEEKEAQKKRKAEDFDSDEENEDEWSKRDAAEQAKKRKVIMEAAKSAPKFVFTPSANATESNSNETSTKKPMFSFATTSNTSQTSKTTSLFGSGTSSPAGTGNGSVFDDPASFAQSPNTDNIFSHLSDVESGAEGSTRHGVSEEDEVEFSGDEDERKAPSPKKARSTRSESSNHDDKDVSGSKSHSSDSGPNSASSGSIHSDVNGVNTSSQSSPPSDQKGQSSSSANTANAQLTGLGRSLFDRIEKDQDGNPVKLEDNKSKSETEAAPGTPKNSIDEDKSKSTNVSTFGQPSNMTWNQNTPIKFGSGESSFGSLKSTAPSLSFSSTSPSKSTNDSSQSQSSVLSFGGANGGKVSTPGVSFASIGSLKSPTAGGLNFASPTLSNGQATKDSKPSFNFSSGAEGGKLGTPVFSFNSTNLDKNQVDGTPDSYKSLFGSASPSHSASSPSVVNPPDANSEGLGFIFGAPSKKGAALAPPSFASSLNTSRSASPVNTNNNNTDTGAESNADSGADGAKTKKEDRKQINLTGRGAGEEDEDAIFEVRTKALWYDHDAKKWVTKGLGPFRLLKHKETGKVRMLMRQDPSGHIVINESLNSHFEYISKMSKIVTIPMPLDNGKKLESWVLKFALAKDAKALIKLLNENKDN